MLSRTSNHRSATLEARWQTIKAKIAAQSQYLVKQGAIVARPTPSGRVWMLRFYAPVKGRKVQRAIYICSDQQTEILARARQLLARYRARADWAQEIAQSARWAALAMAQLRKFCVRQANSKV